MQRLFNLFKFKKTQPEEVLNILVIIKMKPEFRQEVWEMMKTAPEGIALTKAAKGCISVEGRLSDDDKETMIFWGKWASQEDHDTYMKMRMDSGFMDKMKPKMSAEPVFMHLSKDCIV